MRWLARSVAALPADLGWLTPAEAARAARLRFAKRRTEYLLRRLTAKHAVAAAVGLPAAGAVPARIEIANHASGAPYVLVDGAPAGLEISLTDRAGWAVCLVAAATPTVASGWGGGPPAGIGCDLELVEPRSAAFVRDFFTDAERRYTTSRPDGEARHLVANLIWSAKESTLKALGSGLRRDTREIEVTLDPGLADPAGPVGLARVADPVGVAGEENRWRTLAVRWPGASRARTGWWRRDGAFLLTVVSTLAVVSTEPGPAPVALDPAGTLAAARPFPAAYR